MFGQAGVVFILWVVWGTYSVVVLFLVFSFITVEKTVVYQLVICVGIISFIVALVLVKTIDGLLDIASLFE